MKIVLIIITFIVPAILFGQVDTVHKISATIDLKQYFGEFEGGFSVYNIKNGEYSQYNSEHCQKRYSPCSTFKIPNSLIGLETGVAADSDFVIQYDSLLHPRNERMLNTVPFKYWFQDLSMKAAFKCSCVWYYQELARRIGTERMDAHIKLMNYGNNDISNGIDNFWLCGSLQISINEQIDFLKKTLYRPYSRTFKQDDQCCERHHAL
jgi:beta-lactamase class D